MVIRPKFLISRMLWVCMTLVFSCGGVKQVPLVSENKIEQPSVFFEVDNLNNIFIVSPQNKLTKWSKDGEFLYEFSDNRLGAISILDTSNPLQTLVYYPDFSWLRFFDRTLNLTHEISLLELGYQNVNALCSSNDNNIWFYDEIEQIILKIDQEGKVLIKSDDLRQVLEKSIFPKLILERKNKLLFYDKQNIYVFDAFGTYLNSRIIGAARSIVFDGQYCLFLNDKNALVKLDVLSNAAEDQIIEQMEPSVLDYRKGLDCRFYRKKDHVLIKNGLE